MAEFYQLAAETRSRGGTAECRRMRWEGLVPGNLYGHGLDPVMLKAAESEIHSLIHTGAQVVDLNMNGKSEKAILREVQWDSFGTRILHFDLVRIDADERVDVEVPIELKGVAPGIIAGGVMDQHTRYIALECSAMQIPESIEVRIADLEIGDVIHVSDLQLPPGAELQTPGEAIVVQILEPREEEEELAAEEEPGPAEPEVIGRKEEEEESEQPD